MVKPLNRKRPILVDAWNFFVSFLCYIPNLILVYISGQVRVGNAVGLKTIFDR